MEKPVKLTTSNCYQEFYPFVLARFVRLTITNWGRRTAFRFQLHKNTAYAMTAAGIEEGIIKDDQLKSSNYPDDPRPAHEGRLNVHGAWCGNTLHKQLYLQVDFLVNFQGDLKPKHHEYFQNPASAQDDITLAGRHTQLTRNISSRCSQNNPDCRESLRTLDGHE